MIKFRREKTEDYYLFDTNIPNIYIDQYMVDAPGNFVKVYLFAYMYIGIDLQVDNEDIAKHLGLDLADVIAAWEYWKDIGLVRVSLDNELDQTIEFLDLKSMVYGKHASSASKKQTSAGLASLEDESVSKLMLAIEKYVGGFRGNEPQVIVSWIDTYKMPPDVIEYAFKYAKKNWKGLSIASVGDLIVKWSDKELFTITKVEEYLVENSKRSYEHKQIMKAAGKPFNITPNERDTIDKWLDEWGYTVNEIVDIFKKTKGISNPFTYVEAIIRKDRDGGGGKESTGDSAKPTNINEHYRQIREEEEKQASLRREEVYKKIPEIKEIEADIRKMSLKASNIILSKPVNYNEKLKIANDEMDKLLEKRNSLLGANNFEATYMEIKYHCPHCKDTGILDNGNRCSCSLQRMEEMRN